MRRAFVVVGLCAVLAGCNSGPATVDEMASIQSTCDGYGFKRGSDAFAACVLQLDQNRIASAVERRKAMGRSLQQAGANMQNQPRGVNCTSTGYGNTVRTSCY